MRLCLISLVSIALLRHVSALPLQAVKTIDLNLPIVKDYIKVIFHPISFQHSIIFMYASLGELGNVNLSFAFC